MDELTNQSEEVTQETQETTQEFTQEQNQEQSQESTMTQEVETPQSIKVKFNHRELELPYDEAITHIQKGMNYEKAVERARQEAAQQARDSWIEEQGYAWKDKPIKTEAEYKQALQEQELENKIRSQYQNVPDEIVDELLESRKFREQFQSQQKATKEQQDFTTRRDSMYEEYLSEFPEQDPAAIPGRWILRPDTRAGPHSERPRSRIA